MILHGTFNWHPILINMKSGVKEGAFFLKLQSDISIWDIITIDIVSIKSNQPLYNRELYWIYFINYFIKKADFCIAEITNEIIEKVFPGLTRGSTYLYFFKVTVEEM